MLVGLLLAVAAAWSWYAMARLHQGWLLEQVGDALDAAEGRGLRLQPTGLRARLVAQGAADAGPVRIEWRTGVLGPRCVVIGPGGRRRLPLLRTAQDLDRALG